MKLRRKIIGPYIGVNIFFLNIGLRPKLSDTYYHIKGRSPSNGKLSDFSFYIDSQISVHRKFKNRSIDNLEMQKKYISMKNSQFFNYLLYAKSK
jgi:hypothetical protein